VVVIQRWIILRSPVQNPTGSGKRVLLRGEADHEHPLPVAPVVFAKSRYLETETILPSYERITVLTTMLVRFYLG
jgi:hypothetical protein